MSGTLTYRVIVNREEADRLDAEIVRRGLAPPADPPGWHLKDLLFPLLRELADREEGKG